MNSRDKELLVELRRNTAAVRALGRFLLTEASALIVSAFFIALGFTVYSFNDGFGFWLVFLGSLVAIVGTILAVGGGWTEFEKSEGGEGVSDSVREPAYARVDLVPEAPRDGPVLIDRECSCSRFERGLGNTSVYEGRAFCGRCNRYLAID